MWQAASGKFILVSIKTKPTFLAMNNRWSSLQQLPRYSITASTRASMASLDSTGLFASTKQNKGKT